MPTKETKLRDLLKHMIDELVDEPERIEMSATWGEASVVFEIKAPRKEVAQILGSHKKNMHAIQSIMRSVATKYGYRMLITCVNNAFDNSQQDTPAVREMDGPLFPGRR